MVHMLIDSTCMVCRGFLAYNYVGYNSKGILVHYMIVLQQHVDAIGDLVKSHTLRVCVCLTSKVSLHFKCEYVRILYIIRLLGISYKACYK